MASTEDWCREVIEQAPKGVLLYDAQTKRVLKTNPAYRNLLGYTLKEIIGLTLYDIAIHAPESIDCHVQRLLTEKHPLTSEQRHWHIWQKNLVTPKLQSEPISQLRL